MKVASRCLVLRRCPPTLQLRSSNRSMASKSNTMLGAYRERGVVSSFIFSPQSTTNSQTFALFKRSQKVRTYQGKWAVCSGSIETTDTSPLKAAQREICEETALLATEFSLLIKGKPFSLTDDELKTRWTVHPFSWKMTTSSKPITIDWEHTEYRFVKPEELGTFEHVPQLEIGMERILVSEETEHNISILRNTKYSTPTEFASEATKLLHISVSTGDLSKVSTSADLWEELRLKVWHLVENSVANPEAIAGLKAALGTMLEWVMTDLECTSKADIAKKEVEMLRESILGAIQLKLGNELAEIMEGAKGVEQDGNRVWENMMEDL